MRTKKRKKEFAKTKFGPLFDFGFLMLIATKLFSVFGFDRKRKVTMQLRFSESIYEWMTARGGAFSTWMFITCTCSSSVYNNKVACDRGSVTPPRYLRYAHPGNWSLSSLLVRIPRWQPSSGGHCYETVHIATGCNIFTQLHILHYFNLATRWLQ